jgi:23S rRNA pseudouridine2605 synthase
MAIRLNKLLAERGIASRRRCDVLIAEGKVRVNGRVVAELGTVVEEGRDRIEVEGRLIPGKQRLVYYVLNKPVGFITTLDDPQGRHTVRELLPRGARVYPVGRLDADTSGLLLLTNDGELAHKLMHPRYGVVKVYRVRLDREPTRSQLERLSRGVRYEPGVTSAPAVARRIDPGFDAIMIELQIHEGRFRQVRRMCEAVGLTVTGLHRVGYGPLRLGPLARGMFRELSEDEVVRLRAAASRPASTRGRPAKEGRSATAAGHRNAGPERAARPPKPPKPRPPVRSAPPRPADDEDREIEDRWIPGGGFAPELDDEDDADATPVWPARPDSRRGDDDFRARAEGPRSPSRAPSRPASRPQERRPARSPERSDRRTGPTARGERRTGPPARGERRSGPPARGERRSGPPARGERRSGPPARGERRSGPPARGERRSGPPARGERRSGPSRGRDQRPAGRRQDGRRPVGSNAPKRGRRRPGT